VFGIDSEKLVILAIIAVVVLGPQRLPEYSRTLAKWARAARDYAKNAQSQLSEELGEEVDWRQLDPRQYDPRRIIREALLEDLAPAAATLPVGETASVKAVTRLQAGEPAPFDGEAT
jgi:sec-independent protein translocase protein TatB